MGAEGLHPALRAVSDAVLAVTAQRSVEEVLQELVERACELAGARYAALGIPDGSGGFSRFLVTGMSDELIASMGPLPRTHGMLGAMLETARSHRTPDIQDDVRFKGWWPHGHPDMHSFLGVPIAGGDGAVIGAFYLTDKRDAGGFTAWDEEVIELLAAHAAIAIVNARLDERSRELTVLQERNRLALELHDVVSQKLFGVVLSAEAAAARLDSGDERAARAQLTRVGEMSREALDELRSLILELRPAELERDGLSATLSKRAALLARLHEDVAISLDVDDAFDAGSAAREAELLRIATEALHNALRHAAARSVWLRLRDGALEVGDDGTGFAPDDPELRSRHLGLTSMEERAARLGARLSITSSPGSGTLVRVAL